MKYPKLTPAWSPEQISKRLKLDFPDDNSGRISHEAIYHSLYIEGRGALRRELAQGPLIVRIQGIGKAPAASLDSVDTAFVGTPYQLASGLTAEQQIYVEDANNQEPKTVPSSATTSAVQPEGDSQGVFKQLDATTTFSVLAEQEKEFSQQ